MRRNLTRSILILAAIIFALVPVLASLAHGEDFTRSPVLLPSGSGVIIEPGDLVLTAGHLKLTGRIPIKTLSGMETAGAVVSRPQGEGATVLKLERSFDHFARVASNLPQPGEPVTIAAFPRGRFSRRGGIYLGKRGKTTFEGIEFGSFGTSINAVPGDSGGPAFNARGEVIGLVSAGGPGSICVDLGEIKKSLRTMSDNRVRLRVWTRSEPYCHFCKLWEAAYHTDAAFRRSMDSIFKVEVFDSTKFPEQAKKDGANAFPCFIVHGGGRVFGFNDKNKLLAELRKAIPQASRSCRPGCQCPNARASQRDPVNYELLANMIIEKISQDSRFRGPQGPQGEKGPQGEQGSEGASPDLSEVLETVRELRNRRREVILFKDGKIVDRESYAIDEPIVLHSRSVTIEGE